MVFFVGFVNMLYPLGHPEPEGYKYGDLALEVGGWGRGVAHERVRYGLKFCGTWTR
jgi:hypothetical protein